MRTRLIAEALKLVPGVLFWSAALGIGISDCPFFNLHGRIDGLWLKEINPYLVRNLAGQIAFRPKEQCPGGSYLYHAVYRPDPNRRGGEETISLTSLIDLSTWEQVGEEVITQPSRMITFVDSRRAYLYVSAGGGDVLWVYHK